jgi:hypothetical protein
MGILAKWDKRYEEWDKQYEKTMRNFNWWRDMAVGFVQDCEEAVETSRLWRREVSDLTGVEPSQG